MKKETTLDLTYKFLIALPAMGDHRFERSVIFMCHHDQKGAMGLIINKTKGDLTLSEMLPTIGIDGAVSVANSKVLDGGPVDIDRGFVLHSDDISRTPNALPLKHGLCLSSTKDALEALVSKNAPSKALLAIGYAGWGGGQIEREIQDNAWIIAESDPDIIFNEEHDAKWEQAIRSLGIDPSHLSASGGRA